ncbi:unnamed protein product [Amoebophrya sp. A120]|nr:unnamed protein product [Amoebophrya sp. A120]|eukprot:GSA120T00014333001.1
MSSLTASSAVATSTPHSRMNPTLLQTLPGGQDDSQTVEKATCSPQLSATSTTTTTTTTQHQPLDQKELCRVLLGSLSGENWRIRHSFVLGWNDYPLATTQQLVERSFKKVLARAGLLGGGGRGGDPPGQTEGEEEQEEVVPAGDDVDANNLNPNNADVVVVHENNTTTSPAQHQNSIRSVTSASATKIQSSRSPRAGGGTTLVPNYADLQTQELQIHKTKSSSRPSSRAALLKNQGNNNKITERQLSLILDDLFRRSQSYDEFQLLRTRTAGCGGSLLSRTRIGPVSSSLFAASSRSSPSSKGPVSTRNAGVAGGVVAVAPASSTTSTLNQKQDDHTVLDPDVALSNAAVVDLYLLDDNVLDVELVIDQVQAFLGIRINVISATSASSSSPAAAAAGGPTTGGGAAVLDPRASSPSSPPASPTSPNAPIGQKRVSISRQATAVAGSSSVVTTLSSGATTTSLNVDTANSSTTTSKLSNNAIRCNAIAQGCIVRNNLSRGRNINRNTPSSMTKRGQPVVDGNLALNLIEHDRTKHLQKLNTRAENGEGRNLCALALTSFEVVGSTKSSSGKDSGLTGGGVVLAGGGAANQNSSVVGAGAGETFRRRRSLTTGTIPEDGRLVGSGTAASRIPGLYAASNTAAKSGTKPPPGAMFLTATTPNSFNTHQSQRGSASCVSFDDEKRIAVLSTTGLSSATAGGTSKNQPQEQKRTTASNSDTVRKPIKVTNLIRILTREVLFLCGFKLCFLYQCLMNPTREDMAIVKNNQSSAASIAQNYHLHSHTDVGGTTAGHGSGSSAVSPSNNPPATNNNASTIMKASEQTMQQHFEQLGKNMCRLCPICTRKLLLLNGQDPLNRFCCAEKGLQQLFPAEAGELRLQAEKVGCPTQGAS